MRPKPLRGPEDAARKPESGFPEQGGDEGRGERLLEVLAEMALSYARLGDLEAARSAADEALAVLGDVSPPEATVARAALDLGEALVFLGDPSCRELLEDGALLSDPFAPARSTRRGGRSPS